MSIRNLALGLDIGTSRIVVAQPKEDGFEYRSQLNAFVDVPFSKMTKSVLEKTSVPYTTSGDRLVVHGNESEAFANMMQTETRRPMTRGIMNPSEPVSAEVMQALLSSLLEGVDPRQSKVYYSVPAAPPGEESNLTYHDSTIGQVLGRLGFESESVNEGLAVVYSEMEDSNYSGIGISCGGGLCNVCVAYLAVPTLTFAVTKAGDFIDQSAAGVTGELATGIRMRKEQSFCLDGKSDDKVQQVLTVYYEDMIRSLVSALAEHLASPKAPKFSKPVPIVLSGGTAMPKGFLERFRQAFEAAGIKLPVAEIRLAKDPLTATAKGALVAAMAS